MDRVGQIELLNLLIQLSSIHWSGQFGHHVRHATDVLEGALWGAHTSG